MQGRYGEAEAARRKAITIAARIPSGGSAMLYLQRSSLGNLLRLQHRHEEALNELRAVATAIANDDRADDAFAARVNAQLAEAELDAGNTNLAYAAATHALELGQVSTPRGHFVFGELLFALARTELARERPGEAEPLLREALAVRSPPFAADDPRVLEVKVALVDALTALGRPAEAQALRAEIEPLLKASPTPYAKDLIERLPER
jgi:serine/threonine-protein kinase